MWWRKQLKWGAEGEGERKSPQALSHAFTCSLDRLFRFSVSGPGADTWDSKRMWSGTPAPGGEGGWGTGMHHRGEGCHGPRGAHGRGLSLDWVVGNFSSVAGLERETEHGISRGLLSLSGSAFRLSFSADPHELKEDADGLACTGARGCCQGCRRGRCVPGLFSAYGQSRGGRASALYKTVENSPSYFQIQLKSR